MKLLKTMSGVFALGVSLGGPALAQNYTTAAEVRPIVSAIKAQWIAVRPWDGHDLLYFTNLLSWRCGLEKIEYTVNGSDAVELVTEPCYDDTAAPNALKVEDILPYVTLPPESVQTVTVTITYDDGETFSVDYERAAIQIQ